MPAVEKDYVIKSRILFGHSFAGSFTIYTLLNKPNAFDYYIASSPTPIMQLTDNEKYMQTDNKCLHPVVFFHSFDSKDIKQVRKWSKILNENLTGNKFKNIEYKFTILEDKNHSNSDIPALFNGLDDIIQ